MASEPDGRTELRRLAGGSVPGERALAAGTMVAEFEITGIIGGGGFGIVYRAYDHSLHRVVALKEYMPAALAERVPALPDVRVPDAGSLDAFATGLASFVNEARVLAQLDHPSLVKVYRFWEQNGTAYMVMPYYKGVTLKEWLRNASAPPDEAALLRILVPLLDALEVIHAARIYHRDVAPDNVLMVDGGRPVLLDFGAARQVLGDRTQELTTILKPGYAPIEQYSGQAGERQGPYTDLYALGALMYLAVTGERPPPSVARMDNDTMLPAVQAADGRYSPRFLRSIDRCLAIHREGRPQSVQQLRDLLGIDVELPTVLVPPTVREEAPTGRHPRWSRSPAATRLVLAAVAVGLLGAFAVWRLLQHDEPHAPVAAGGTPVVADARVVAPAAAPARDAMLHALHDLRDRAQAVTVEVVPPRVRIGQDKPSFRVASAADGYVYVLRLGTDSDDLAMLFPNAIDADNRIDAGRALSLPRKGWHFVADGPPGTNHLIAIVASTPRDFTAAGLRKGDPFDHLPRASIVERAKAAAGSLAFLAGACLGEPCDPGFGAALFTIDQYE